MQINNKNTWNYNYYLNKKSMYKTILTKKGISWNLLMAKTKEINKIINRIFSDKGILNNTKKK